MKSKNPIGQESGFSYDAFTDGILDSPNNTTSLRSCQQCVNHHSHYDIKRNCKIIIAYLGTYAPRLAYWLINALGLRSV